MFKEVCIYIATGAAWHSAFLKKKRLCTVHKGTPGGSLFGFALVFEKGLDQCLSIWYRSIKHNFLNTATEALGAAEAAELAVGAAERVATSELVAALVALGLTTGGSSTLGLTTSGGTGLVAASRSTTAGGDLALDEGESL